MNFGLVVFAWAVLFTVHSFQVSATTEFRIRFTGVRDDYLANSIQLAEFVLYKHDMTGTVTGFNAENPHGDSPDGEQVNLLFDGETTSKWLDLNFVVWSESVVKFVLLDEDSPCYHPITADDSPERDPISWTLERLNSATNQYEIISEVSHFPAPYGRNTYYTREPFCTGAAKPAIPVTPVNPDTVGATEFQIRFTGIRESQLANSIQLAELLLYNHDMTETVTGFNAENPGGESPSGEEVNLLFDGKISSKWLDFNFGAWPASVVKFTLLYEDAPCYIPVTADDALERDPVSWTLERLNSATNQYEIVSEVSNYPAPYFRNSYYTSKPFCSAAAIPVDSGTGELLKRESWKLRDISVLHAVAGGVGFSALIGVVFLVVRRKRGYHRIGTQIVQAV